MEGFTCVLSFQVEDIKRGDIWARPEPEKRTAIWISDAYFGYSRKLDV
jgi:hypothetical protein